MFSFAQIEFKHPVYIYRHVFRIWQNFSPNYLMKVRQTSFATVKWKKSSEWKWFGTFPLLILHLNYRTQGFPIIFTGFYHKEWRVSLWITFCLCKQAVFPIWELKNGLIFIPLICSGRLYPISRKINSLCLLQLYYTTQEAVLQIRFKCIETEHRILSENCNQTSWIHMEGRWLSWKV